MKQSRKAPISKVAIFEDPDEMIDVSTQNCVNLKRLPPLLIRMIERCNENPKNSPSKNPLTKVTCFLVVT